MKFIFGMFLILSLISCSKPTSSPDSIIRIMGGESELNDILKEFPDYWKFWSDKHFRREFDRYMSWFAYDLKIDNAVYLVGLVDQGIKSVDLHVHLFHEMVELKLYFDRGLSLDKAMEDPTHYNAYYDEWYNSVHCNAIIAQERVLNAFANKMGFRSLPMIAYDLVMPDYERWGRLQDATMPVFLRQLHHNQAYFEEQIIKDDVFEAMRVFEAGGYKFIDPSRYIDMAERFLRLPHHERLETIGLKESFKCDELPFK